MASQPQLTEGGVRVFSAASAQLLEQSINTFLAGDETAENPRKVLVESPTLVISGGVFYTIAVFKKASSLK